DHDVPCAVIAGDGQVEELPTADGVVDEVPFGAGPQGDSVPAQFLRNLLHGDDGPVDRVAGHTRRAVADELVAHGGTDAVGADERRAGETSSGIGDHRDAFRGL